MDELADAIIVDFPLRGENWVAVNSPGDRIPSHGTDILAQRYAFDFFRTDDRPGLRYHRWEPVANGVLGRADRIRRL